MSPEERLKYVSDMQDFVQCSFLSFDRICTSLGWSASEFKIFDSKDVQCPLDKGHWMPKRKLSKHLEICTLKKDGYSESDILLPPSNSDEKHSIRIDLDTRKKILSSAISSNSMLKLGVENILKDERPVPKTVDRSLADFTVDERRVLYDFAVSQTSGPSAGRNVQDIQFLENIGRMSTEPAKTTKTLEEMMIEMRDAKRRRASYKGKKVKAKSRCYTETLKNLIETQMDIFKEMTGGGSLPNENKDLAISNKLAEPDKLQVSERPLQLYEKKNLFSNQWAHLGDWVLKDNKRNDRDDLRSISEKNTSRHHNYHHVDKYFDRHRKTDKGYRDRDKDKALKRKRSGSPVCKKSKFESDSTGSCLSFSKEKDEIKDSHEKNKDSSHFYSDHISKRYPKHQEGLEKYSSNRTEGSCEGRSLSKQQYRSRSRSHSHLKHRKHKKESKKKQREGHSEEQQEYHKSARYDSCSDENEEKYDRSSNNRDEERSENESLKKQEYRSHSCSHSRSKHKKRKKECKERQHIDHSKEQEGHGKRSRCDSHSDGSERIHDGCSKDKSSDHKHHSSHKKKKKEKNEGKRC